MINNNLFVKQIEEFNQQIDIIKSARKKRKRGIYMKNNEYSQFEIKKNSVLKMTIPEKPSSKNQKYFS